MTEENQPAMYCCGKLMHECIAAEKWERPRWYCDKCLWVLEAVEPDNKIPADHLSKTRGST